MAGEGGRQVPSPSMNPRAHSHEALKEMTDAANPAGSQTVADTWGALGGGFDEAAELFQRAMLSSEPGWSGAAAEAMRGQLARIAAWSKETAAACRAAGAAIGAQSEAAGSAKRAMPPPVPYDPAQMIRDAQASGNIFELAALPLTMYARKREHDAAHEEAVRIVAERDRAFGTAAGQVRDFQPPPSLREDASGVEAPGGAPGPVRRTDDTGPDAVPDTVAIAHPPRPAAGPVPAAPPPTGAVPEVTAPGSFAPGPVLPSYAGAPDLPGLDFGPGGAGQAQQFGPSGAPLPASAPVARFGPAAAEAPAEGAPAKATAGGEPKRPEYLIEPDADEMFGFTELAAPPVIGQE